MIKNKLHALLFLCALTTALLSVSGCGRLYKSKERGTILLKAGTATEEQLINEVRRYASINSMRAKMDLLFEDDSKANEGLTETYITVNSEMVVQRPASILFKVQTPVVSSDMVQMTSNGEKFRVAVIEDFHGGKYKKFVSGTNAADYSALQQKMKTAEMGVKAGEAGKKDKQDFSAFASMRPQHFTESILVRPPDAAKYFYAQSEIVQEENAQPAEKSALKAERVLRGYYLLEEFSKTSDGNLSIARRFWFDRTSGVIRLVRQQVFNTQKEIESDISYGQWGNLGNTGSYNNLPLKIEIARPKEKYKITLTYQTPETISIDKPYPAKAFTLENTWNLPEVDLDEKLREIKSTAAN